MQMSKVPIISGYAVVSLLSNSQLVLPVVSLLNNSQLMLPVVLLLNKSAGATRRVTVK